MHSQLGSQGISGERGSANIVNLAKVEFDASSAKVQNSRIAQVDEKILVSLILIDLMLHKGYI